ncbi:MAG: DNA topoisomerase IV subunit A [Lentisphaerae bacterium]|nr:DNA topoisomerase IV subunit A [Lentisphaerota bacterium]
MSDEFDDPQIVNAVEANEEENDSAVLAKQKQGTNDYFRRMFDRNFLDYASYVIGSRAIPDVDDGLKPVQRRILWALYQVYDGRTQKVANIVGNTMHYHPHGDASIGDALVVLANKGGMIENTFTDRRTKVEKKEYISVPYFIMKQGNFGNILTGSPAAAGRYTECGLTKLAYETMFNNDITPFVPNYDGRKEEPVVLPAKVPSLLMLGSDGIAVGMSTCVLPHNFNELIDAEIAVLQGRSFQLYPDFQQGALMDVREYDDGNGRVILRAKIDIDGRDLVIREIPANCTSESLVNSIEKAAEKNKIRISSVSDFTTDHVEIRVTPTRGYTPEQTLQGLYMYTDCSISISSRIVVICDRKPVQMSVSEVLKRNVEKLVGYLKQELEIDLERQNELRHAKTLAQLFFENRIYKKIEECRSQEEEYQEVHAGLKPFCNQLMRDVTDEDIDKLLALPVRRIARFDIEKNEQELREIDEKIKKIRHKLSHLIDYTIEVLSDIKKKYGANFPRRTEIENIEQIDRKAAALNNIKVGWDRKAGYVGTAVKSDDVIVCNEYDRLLCVEKSGKYKVIPMVVGKLFLGKLYDFRKYDSETQFGIIYKETKSGKYYGKRTTIGGFILEKEYNLCPEGCKLELFTPRADAIYIWSEEDARGKVTTREINLMEFPVRAPKARGFLISSKNMTKVTHSRYLTEEEIAALVIPDDPEADITAEDAVEDTAVVEEQEIQTEEKKIPIPKGIMQIVAAAKESAKNAVTVPVKAEETATEEITAVPEKEPVAEEVVTAAENTPVEEAPAEDASVADTPVEEAPKEEVQVEDTPCEDTPAEEVQVEDAPVADTPVEEETKEEVRGEDTPVEDTPAAENSAVEEETWALSAEPEDQPRKRKPRTQSAPAKPVTPPDDDDLGIIQPEFGF